MNNKILKNDGYSSEIIKEMIKVNSDNDYDEDRLSEYLEYFGKDNSFISSIEKEYPVGSLEFKTKYLYPKYFSDMNTKESVFNSYNEASEMYSLRQLMGRPQKFDNELKIFDFMKKNLSANSIVLDYGCCVGDFSILFSKMGYKVISVDLDIPTFSFAKRRFKNRKLDIETFSVHYDMIPPVLNNKVDFIFCRDVLEHTVNPIEVLQFFYDNLNVGGYMYLSTMNPGDKIYIGAEHLEKTIKLSDTKSYKDFFEDHFVITDMHGLYIKK